MLVADRHAVHGTPMDDAFPDGTYNYWKSTFLRDFSDEAVDLVIEHANRMRSPLSGVVVEYYGGAMNRVGLAERPAGTWS